MPALPSSAIALRSNDAFAANAVHVLYGETMGTRWRVNVVAGKRADLARLHALAQARLDAIVAQMSTWRPDSDICRYNRADAGTWHELPQDFFDVLQCALRIADASDGAYDPTVGALVALWGFGADGGMRRVPDARKIDAACERSGWRRVELRAGSRSVLQPGGVSLDLSAIAKGYGADAVATALRGAGIAAALVEVGGELYGYGRKPDGSAWRVLVETPDDDDTQAPCVLTLDDRAAATSGDRWHRFEHAGEVYAHTLDPRSGRPVARAAASVTVVADDAMQADAWATALTVMGIEAGHAFASAQGLAARFLARTADGDDIRATPAFAALVAA